MDNIESTPDPSNPAPGEPVVPPVDPAADPDQQSGGTSTKDRLRQSADHLKAQAAAKGQELKAKAEAKAAEFRTRAESKAAELRSQAEMKAQELRDVAEAKAGEFKVKANQAYEEAKSKAKVYQADGEKFVRENPMKACIYALCAGFVLGLIFRR
jgi:ElaB/YqjD/DUF883 family membrane-anchored ribosome-binding protein